MELWKLWTPSRWDRNRKIWDVHAITVDGRHLLLATRLTRKEAKRVAERAEWGENIIASFVRKNERF